MRYGDAIFQCQQLIILSVEDVFERTQILELDCYLSSVEERTISIHPLHAMVNVESFEVVSVMENKLKVLLLMICVSHICC